MSPQEQPERPVLAETTPCGTAEHAPIWSPETFVLWGRMDDGSAFLAIIDPDPREDE